MIGNRVVLLINGSPKRDRQDRGLVFGMNAAWFIDTKHEGVPNYSFDTPSCWMV